MEPLEAGHPAGLEPATVERLRALGGDSFVERLVGVLLEQAPLHVAAVTEAARRGDADAVRRAAHTLRSTAGTVGATSLLAAAERVEALALAAPPPESLTEAAAALETEWNGLRRVLSPRP
jgi:HPt (histidine-containing phosphotransfer) domain-containing protein